MLATALLALCLAGADDRNPAEGVKKVELVVEPAEAKPGQTVTLKLTVTLAAGCHTYPFAQADKAAGNFVSKAKFPAAAVDGLIYVGDITATTDPESKPEPALGVKALQFFTTTVTFEKKAVVSPNAKPGELAAKIASLKLNVCDERDCFKPTELKPEAKFKVAGEPVAVEKQFADDVKKALEAK